MNIYEKVKEQATRRMIILCLGVVTIGFFAGGATVALAAVAGVLAAPMVIAITAFFWTTAAEWTKLGIAELYGAAAQQKMEAAGREQLRDTLDEIGQEALDEVEAAIERRDENV